MTLSQSETRAAVDYNIRQGYCTSEIKLTQRTVGAVEDGIWGPDTVQRVADWQPSRCLTPDGKVGPKTWAAIKASWELVPVEPSTIDIGCGLAAYDQTWPGHTPQQALDKALDAALADGCKEVRYWSSEWLIDDQGNKGNSYSGPWLAERPIPADVVVGAWVDDPVSTAKTAEFADALVKRQVRRAALMINRSNTRPADVPWSLRWNEQSLADVSSMLHSRDIEVVCTTWPRPSKTQIDTMLFDMGWILDVTGSTTFEVDTEGNWTSKYLEGFESMRDAAEYLANGMRALATTIELTTYTYHTENGPNAVLAPLMDRLLPQAYSVRHRGNQVVEWDDPLGPGYHQDLALGRARQAADA